MSIFPFSENSTILICLSLLILKVIICTDGKANTKLGDLEEEDIDARTLLSSTIFYQELGEYAASQGLVHISSLMSRMEQYKCTLLNRRLTDIYTLEALLLHQRNCKTTSSSDIRTQKGGVCLLCAGLE